MDAGGSRDRHVAVFVDRGFRDVVAACREELDEFEDRGVAGVAGEGREGDEDGDVCVGGGGEGGGGRRGLVVGYGQAGVVRAEEGEVVFWLGEGEGDEDYVFGWTASHFGGRVEVD